jgi:hypothetical protein
MSFLEDNGTPSQREGDILKRSGQGRAVAMSRSRIKAGLRRAHRTALDRCAWKEHAVAADRPRAAVGIYSRLAGYEDVNDAERLSQDPAFRLIGSEKVVERGAAQAGPAVGPRPMA